MSLTKVDWSSVYWLGKRNIKYSMPKKLKICWIENLFYSSGYDFMIIGSLLRRARFVGILICKYRKLEIFYDHIEFMFFFVNKPLIVFFCIKSCLVKNVLLIHLMERLTSRMQILQQKISGASQKGSNSKPSQPFIIIQSHYLPKISYIETKEIWMKFWHPD